MNLEAEEKLHSLKLRIIEAGFPVRRIGRSPSRSDPFQIKWFHTPQQMADQVEEDFTLMVKRDFPLEVRGFCCCPSMLV